MKLNDPRIVCAACRIKDDGFIICSPRHVDNTTRATINKIYGDNSEIYQRDSMEQGFVDQFGNFLTRKEAWVIAVKNGQIIRDLNLSSSNDELFSEHLY